MIRLAKQLYDDMQNFKDKENKPIYNIVKDSLVTLKQRKGESDRDFFARRFAETYKKDDKPIRVRVNLDFKESQSDQ